MAKKQSYIQELFDGDETPIELLRKSNSWHVFKQRELRIMNPNLNANRIINSSPPNRYKNFLLSGKMYLFRYDDPITMREMQYWDRVPLVIVWGEITGGFIGINLHHMPYRYRIRFLRALMKTRTSNKLDGRSRLKISWEIVKRYSRIPTCKKAVRRYKYNLVTSKIVEVYGNEWIPAAALPIEEFDSVR